MKTGIRLAPRLPLALLALTVMVMGCSVTDNNRRSAAERFVDQAALTVQEMKRDRSGDYLSLLLYNAAGVIIFPELTRVSLGLGGEGGTGILVARKGDGGWTGPAFFRAKSGSIGFQVGYQKTKLMLIFMDPTRFKDAVRGSFDFGADVSAVAGDDGRSQRYTTDPDAPVYSFAKTDSGVYAGASFQGTLLEERRALTQVYYNRLVTAEDVLLEQSVPAPPDADALREALTGTPPTGRDPAQPTAPLDAVAPGGQNAGS